MGKYWDKIRDSNSLNLAVCTPKAILDIHMTKIKFVKHLRSIVRKLHDRPTSLLVTIPKKIVRDWRLKAVINNGAST
jgi:hypothetical protein